MIIDIRKFIAQEQPLWHELERFLDRLRTGSGAALSLVEVRRLHYLYERVSADLDQLTTLASEQATCRYVSALVARAYAEIHETRARPRRLRPREWLGVTLPQAFRRRLRAFQLACAVTLAGSLFGGLVLALDPPAKEILIPFGHLMGRPAERVAEEEQVDRDTLADRKAQGAAFYITHNTRVALTTLAMGALWGVGTLVLLFYNGVLLGAVAVDYILDGQGVFLAGWLLPHGSVEIPALLLAGQAGLVLGGALIGWGRRQDLAGRLREASGDLLTLVIAMVILLVWAGIIEAFFSQYHEPAVPYWLKIAHGSAQVLVLTAYVWWSGRRSGGG